MKRIANNCINSDPSSTIIYRKDGKAALEAAFQWSPVALAFLVSSLCLSFLANFESASATSSEMQDPSSILSSQTDTITPAHSIDSQLHALSPVFTKEVLYWEKEIFEWSNTYHLDSNLIATVMQIESCGNPNAESGSGAKGLFQVMPFHFSQGDNPFDPDTNAFRGLSYLSRSMEIASNDPALALAGYNGGHSVISLGPFYWFEETKRYVYWGSGILADINAGEIQSSRLMEWMRAGGESLCDRSSAELGL